MTNSTKGVHIRDARKAKGLTQKELAALLGCSHTTISKYEQGEIETMSLPRMKQLASILDASPVFLFGLTDEYKKESAPEDELSATKKQLLDWIRDMPETQAVDLLAALRSSRQLP